MLTIKPVGKMKMFQTRARVENDHGDGRHNRAGWRSALEKTEIPSGFLFGIDSAGVLFDFSTPTAALKAPTLKAQLLSVSSPVEAVGPPEETLESVIATLPGGATEAVQAVMAKMNFSAHDLRLLIEESKAPLEAVEAEPAESPTVAGEVDVLATM